jgi:pectinesterase
MKYAPWFVAPIFAAGLPLFAAGSTRPDLTVAADGSGDFQTVQAAVASLSPTNSGRVVVFIKDGVYREKVRVDAPAVTLLGQSRAGTRIEFPQLREDFNQKPDDLGAAVININADDFVMEHLTVENTDGTVGPHAFAVYGTGDRTVIADCDVLSHGADTVSLWQGKTGRYYHANCHFQGSVDFVCPRGWCYVTNCSFYELKNTASVWHDGSKDKDQKFVLNHCRFDGVDGFHLGRHHFDEQFYFLDCTFAKTMADTPPRRVVYPLDGGTPSAADLKKNAENDKKNLYGERVYFWNCHRDGGDFAWFTNNLAAAAGAPAPTQFNAAWTFGNTWNPERTDGPIIRTVTRPDAKHFEVGFSEDVTVKGQPRLALRGDAGFARYVSGSGSDTLVFAADQSGEVASIDLNGGGIIATEAGIALRPASLTLPVGATGGK